MVVQFEVAAPDLVAAIELEVATQFGVVATQFEVVAKLVVLYFILLVVYFESPKAC